MWSDEKQFKLYVPDRYGHHWSNLSIEDDMMSRRQSKGGGVMVFGLLSYYGRLKVVEVESSMNAKYYMEILQQQLIPYVGRYHSEC